MTEFPKTSYSLLVQLRSNSDRQAWEDFVEIYRPVIYRMARRRGLQDADAQDLTQQVLVSVAGSVGKWEKANDQVRFRHWLRRVAKNAAINAVTRAPRETASGGTVVQEMMARHADDSETPEDILETEYRRELYHRASKIVQADVDSETWDAFRLTVVEEVPIKDAARQLGKTVGTIYAARSRIMKRIRHEVAEIEKAEQ